eukprot:gene21756-25817_t
MVALGNRIARVTQGSGLIFLEGDLGAGKTTLSRGIIRGLGHAGAVKSPTFTLVEPYEIGDVRAFHFDLYRLVDPEELEYMGIRTGFLPKPDLTITITPHKQGRQLKLLSQSARGESWCAALALEFK